VNLLVIDDDEELAMLLKMRLEDQGHGVDLAFNGIDGYNLALDHPYDVIILDLMLPGKNGRQISSELRQAKVYSPILLVSALDVSDEINRGTLTGTDDFLIKPFRFEDLYSRIINLHNTNKNTGGSKK